MAALAASDPLISFVLPCYNYGRYLPECLDRVLGLEGGYNFEVIVVNDASPDNTADVLSRYRDPRLRVITHGTNQGQVAAVTHGLEAARGVFAARIDADDRYHPHFLTTLLPVLEANPRVGMAYGDACIIDDAGRRTVESCERVHGHRDFQGNELVGLLECNFICAPTAIARTAAWRGVLPLPEELRGSAIDDWYYNVMMARNWDNCYVNRVVADYRVHAANLHARVIQGRGDEAPSLWLLDLVFSTPERDPQLEAAKQKARSRVYGAQYLTLARKYFGRGMRADARRLYLAALRSDPAFAIRAGALSQLFGATIGIERYQALKASLLGRSSHTDV